MGKVQTYVPKKKEKAVELIEAYIIKNNLNPGDTLPSERDMCEMWGLNRTTLRSAIAELAKMDILVSVHGSGTRLAPRFIRNLQELQGFGEYAKASKYELTNQLLSSTVTECNKDLAARFKRVIGDKLYRIVRLRALNGIPVLIETAFVPVEMAPGLEEHDLVHGSLFDTLRNAYGLELCAGSEKTSITYANDEEAEYLGIEAGAPLYWIVSTTCDSKGNVIEYCRSVGRADVMEMTSTMTWHEKPESEVSHE